MHTMRTTVPSAPRVIAPAARPGGPACAQSPAALMIASQLTSEDVAAVPLLFRDPYRGDEIDEVLPGTRLGQQGRVAPLPILRKALRRLAQADHQCGVCLRPQLIEPGVGVTRHAG